MQKNTSQFRSRFGAHALLLASALCGLALTARAMDHSFVISEYEGTATCLQCHTAHAENFMETIHWTWDWNDGEQDLGKDSVINNYCVAVPSNEPRCTSCHAGYGWSDKTFDFTIKENVDCLVCHDTTGTYKKTPTGAGAPDPTVDLLNVAQNVGDPSRQTCGACHFYGGGGDAVKHGDLDSTMANPTREVDVHMGGEQNMQCTACHVEQNLPNYEGSDDYDHTFIGSRYPSDTPDHMLCESCHTPAPHESANLNSHASRVACQTCHIPEFARGGKATKMWWDWSTAGEKNEDGSDKVVRDDDGNVIYHTKKGTFVWEDNVIPAYRWYNGGVTYVTLDDTFAPDDMVTINQLHGDVNDTSARLFPVKHFTGIQPYDAGTGNLAIPHLFGPDENAYWKSYDWTKALTSGMEYVDRTFTGPVGFIESEMFWIENHMVAPAEDALTCTSCHVQDSRIDFASLGYEPARAEFLQNLFQPEGFKVLSAGMNAEGTAFEIQFEAKSGSSYQVQRSTDLKVWNDAPGGSLTATDDSPLYYADSEVSGNWFYRILRSE